MGKLESMKDLFAGRHFERDVIILCVRWYLRYELSLRDLVEMMAGRGLSLAHTTILRWVKRLNCPYMEEFGCPPGHPSVPRRAREALAPMAAKWSVVGGFTATGQERHPA